MTPLILLQLLAPLLARAATPAASAPATEANRPQPPPAIDPALLAALVAAATPPRAEPLPEIKLPRAAAAVASIVIIGFFALLGAIVGMLVFGHNEFGAALAVLCVGFGVCASKFGTVVDFLFGSSWGSRQKDVYRPTEPVLPVDLPLPLPAPEPAPEPLPTPEPTPAPEPAPEPTPQPPPPPVLAISGKISTFGGPADHGSGDPNEGLALYEEAQAELRPDLFLSVGPGLFRRLNPAAYYLAARWDYAKTSKSWLRAHKVKLAANGKTIEADAVDWGPHISTGRALDISPGAAEALGLQTDDTAIAEVPLPAAAALPQDRPGGSSWLARAVALRGLYEKAGPADNPAILEMARVCGGNIAKTYKHDAIYWCALYINYCLVASKYPGNDSLWALDFAKYGRKLSGPAAGAIASKRRDGGGHVFFVLGRTSSGQLVGIGGNQSNMVCDDVFDPDSIVSYNWPEDAPAPAAVGMSTLPVVAPKPMERREVDL